MDFCSWPQYVADYAEVMSHLAPGEVLPRLPPSLLPQFSSPVSTLTGMPLRPGSTHSTPTAQTLLGGPPPMGGFGQLPTSLPPRPSPQAGGYLNGGSFGGSGQQFAGRLGSQGGSSGGVSRGSSFGAGPPPVPVSLPENLYGGGGDAGASRSVGRSTSLNVTAKPFTMSPSSQPSFGSHWGGLTGNSSGAPTPRSLSSLSPSVQPPQHAPYPAGPAGYGAGGSGAYSSVSQAQQLPRSSTVPPSLYASSGRATPGAYSTPGQSPTAASMLPSLISAPPPGSGQTMSLYGGGGGESDGGLYAVKLPRATSIFPFVAQLNTFHFIHGRGA